MMEPLTAFFILEGLTFDIIGAILIVSGIISFKIKYTKNVNKFMRNVAAPLILDYFRFHKIKEGYLDIKEITKHADISPNKTKNNLDFSSFDTSNLERDLNEQEKDFSINRAYSGLSFLIGGFLLQGIGVITQL